MTVEWHMPGASGCLAGSSTASAAAFPQRTCSGSSPPYQGGLWLEIIPEAASYSCPRPPGHLCTRLRQPDFQSITSEGPGIVHVLKVLACWKFPLQGV
jgi:hypothetical protein